MIKILCINLLYKICMLNIHLFPSLLSPSTLQSLFLETLESARAQTYQHIELIISDDCSTDDTIAICRNWIVRK